MQPLAVFVTFYQGHVKVFETGPSLSLAVSTISPRLCA